VSECCASAGQAFYLLPKFPIVHLLNCSVIVLCGSNDSSSGVIESGIFLDNNGFLLDCVNFTMDTTPGVGSAIALSGESATLNGLYINIESCSGDTIVHHNDGPLIPIFERSNFYSNVLLSDGGVLFGNSYGMVVRNCIFKGNPSGRDILIGGTVTTKFTITGCVFSGGFPNSAYINSSGVNVASSTTASFSLQFIVTVICSASPCPTASQSLFPDQTPLPTATATSTASDSLSPSASASVSASAVASERESESLSPNPTSSDSPFPAASLTMIEPTPDESLSASPLPTDSATVISIVSHWANETFTESTVTEAIHSLPTPITRWVVRRPRPSPFD
jgi:hypothetical protein